MAGTYGAAFISTDGIKITKCVCTITCDFIVFAGNQTELSADFVVRACCRHGVCPGYLVVLPAGNE